MTMTYSDASRPDLDWSQIRETIKLLTVSAAQMDGSMKDGDASVNALAMAFTGMVENLAAIREQLTALVESENREAALAQCDAARHRIDEAIVEFQFYDRLQQCLQHVSANLKDLSAMIDTPHRLYNPAEWCALQDAIRGRYTMEAEKVMFDAIHQGKSIEEALALFEAANQTGGDPDIQLF